jgi:hypothetical protein
MNLSNIGKIAEKIKWWHFAIVVFLPAFLISLTTNLNNLIPKGEAVVQNEASGTYSIDDSLEGKEIEEIITDVSFDTIPDSSFIPTEKGKMIRANLVTKKIVWYEDGILVYETNILNAPKKGTIWETPGGAFGIINKEDDFYSERARLWFPYSMHFLGNYFLHGEPHDSKNKIQTKNTNGGIRLSNSDAQKLYAWTDVGTRISIWSDSKLKPEIIDGASVYITTGGKVRPKVSAESYLVGDLDTGEIILSSNENRAYPIASVTKLMTALTALEKFNFNDTTTISRNAVSSYSTAGLKAGTKIKIGTLVYPLLLSSSNHAAQALVEHDKNKSFITRMNEVAKDIGMEQTVFKDASGLSSGNISTVLDLFKLSRYTLEKQPFIFDLTKQKSYTQNGYFWKNISQFLNTPGYLGGKTGLTSAAKQSSVAIFNVPLSETNKRNIVIILLRSNDRVGDTSRLLSFIKSRVVYGKADGFKVISTPELSRDVVVSFVGDIMMDRGVKYSVFKNLSGDYSKIFPEVPIFEKSDIVFGNLEGDVSDKGRDLGNLYSFRMDPKILPILKEKGFNIFSFANNHVGDWAREAFEDTLVRLDDNGILYAGAGFSKEQAETPKIINIKGLKVGFIAFTDVGPDWLEAKEDSSGILLAKDSRFKEIIKNAKAQSDILVVSIHFGNEYSPHNSRQEILAKMAIDMGANIIVGHHPHVIQDIETYNGGLIMYSLGNFIFDQKFSKETMQGLIVDVTLDAKDKMIKRYDTRLSKQNSLFQIESVMPYVMKK